MNRSTSKRTLLGASLLALWLPTAAGQAGAQPGAGSGAVSLPVAAANAATPSSSYVTVGQFYYGQGNFQRAAVAYGAAVQANPTNPDALLGLARSQTRLGQSAEAIATLGRLIALDPSNISARIALSQAHSLAFRQSRVPRAGGAPARPADDANLRAALSALDAAEQALSALPAARRGTEASKVWNERGFVLRFRGDLRGAAAAFQRANQLNPQEGVILFNLAETQYAGGDLAGATATIQRAVLAQPRDGLNRAYLARLLAEGGNFAAARPQAAVAVQLAPLSAYAAGQYGVVSYLAREPQTARDQLERAARLGGTYPDFLYFLGRLNLDAGDLTRARASFAEAAASGEHPEAAYFLGLSLERSAAGVPAQATQAAEAYRQALALRPDYPEAREGLERLGQPLP